MRNETAEREPGKNSACALAPGVCLQWPHRKGWKLAKKLVSACVVLRLGRCFKSKDLDRSRGACVFLRSAVVANQKSGHGLRGRLRSVLSTGVGASPEQELRGVVSEAPARRRLEGGPIPLCSGSPFCEAAAVAAAAAAGASDWVSESGTGANQRGQRTGGARHGECEEPISSGPEPAPAPRLAGLADHSGEAQEPVEPGESS